MKLEDLKNLRALTKELNISGIAREASIEPITLLRRIERNSPELSENESKKIIDSLQKRKKNIKKSLNILVQTLDKV